MNLNLPLLIVAFLVGSGLGLVYFGGLWFTLQKLPNSPQLIPWMLGSLLPAIRDRPRQHLSTDQLLRRRTTIHLSPNV